MHKVFSQGDSSLAVDTFDETFHHGGPYAKLGWTAVNASWAVDIRFFDNAELYRLYLAIGEALDELVPGLVSPLPEGETNPEAERIRCNG